MPTYNTAPHLQALPRMTARRAEVMIANAVLLGATFHYDYRGHWITGEKSTASHKSQWRAASVFLSMFGYTVSAENELVHLWRHVTFEVTQP